MKEQPKSFIAFLIKTQPPLFWPSSGESLPQFYRSKCGGDWLAISGKERLNIIGDYKTIDTLVTNLSELEQFYKSVVGPDSGSWSIFKKIHFEETKEKE